MDDLCHPSDPLQRQPLGLRPVECISTAVTGGSTPRGKWMVLHSKRWRCRTASAASPKCSSYRMNHEGVQMTTRLFFGSSLGHSFPPLPTPSSHAQCRSISILSLSEPEVGSAEALMLIIPPSLTVVRSTSFSCFPHPLACLIRGEMMRRWREGRFESAPRR